MKLVLFDLDNTLLPIDSDYEWGQFLVNSGAIDSKSFKQQNDLFFSEYLNGTLDPIKYLNFSLEILSKFKKKELDDLQSQFMKEIILPVILPSAVQLVNSHNKRNNLIIMITATNSFIAHPIAKAFGIDNLIAANPEVNSQGKITGNLIGKPNFKFGKIINLIDWLKSKKKSFKDFEKVIFYSDSHNDIPLLSIVSEPVATNPNEALSKHAKIYGWKIIKLFND
tara:strand:+ start:994 stop:1665 length:672 start_codon:yes stop_codon:yes gene_type:complete